MKKSKLIAAFLCSASMVLGSVTPAMADAMRVVTLGADLTDEQKQTMMKYFKVSADEVEVLYITNQDERDQLSSYVPLEQIGSRTVSCAYVRPTTSGGIKVRTANLNWVTGNMIATTLSTSGVKNCEVIAACPFEVSGTGALTGIQMAYEKASGETLDENKKELATEEIVVTGTLADEVGKNDATSVINQAKMEIVGNNIQNADEIYNVVNNIMQENNVSVDSEQIDKIVSLLEQIAQQGYNYDDMKETLEQVEQNVTEGSQTDETTEEVTDGTEETDPDSIMSDVDDSILGEDVKASSTEDPSLEVETGVEENVPAEETVPAEENVSAEGSGEETGIPDATEDGTVEEGSELDTSLLSEQALSMFEKAKDFCAGEFEGDATALQDAMEDETAAVTVTLEEETGKKISDEIKKIYYTILKDGTDSYELTGEEVYMSTELNMLQKELQKLFGIEPTEITGTEEDILLNVPEEDKQTLYSDTMKFFEMVYGESTETVSTEAAGEAEGQTYEQEAAETSYEGEAPAEETSYEGEAPAEETGTEEGMAYDEEVYYYE